MSSPILPPPPMLDSSSAHEEALIVQHNERVAAMLNLESKWPDWEVDDDDSWPSVPQQIPFLEMMSDDGDYEDDSRSWCSAESDLSSDNGSVF